MPPTHLAPSAKPKIGRYLTFSEREDIAIELAKGGGIRSVAPQTWPIAQYDLARGSAQCCDAWR